MDTPSFPTSHRSAHESPRQDFFIYFRAQSGRDKIFYFIACPAAGPRQGFLFLFEYFLKGKPLTDQHFQPGTRVSAGRGPRQDFLFYSRPGLAATRSFILFPSPDRPQQDFLFYSLPGWGRNKVFIYENA